MSRCATKESKSAFAIGNKFAPLAQSSYQMLQIDLLNFAAQQTLCGLLVDRHLLLIVAVNGLSQVLEIWLESEFIY